MIAINNRWFRVLYVHSGKIRGLLSLSRGLLWGDLFDVYISLMRNIHPDSTRSFDSLFHCQIFQRLSLPVEPWLRFLARLPWPFLSLRFQPLIPLNPSPHSRGSLCRSSDLLTLPLNPFLCRQHPHCNIKCPTLLQQFSCSGRFFLFFF